MNSKNPSQRGVALRMRELTNNEFCGTDASAIVFVNQILIGNKKLPEKYVEQFLIACDCRTINEISKKFPLFNAKKITDNITRDIELHVTQKDSLLSITQINKLLSICDQLKTLGFTLEVKISP